MPPSFLFRWSSISGWERTGSKPSSDLVVSGVLLERGPISANHKAGEIEAANPERVDEDSDQSDLKGIGKDHETDAEHYREHCWLIGISTPLHRQLSGNSYRDLVSQASPESRD